MVGANAWDTIKGRLSDGCWWYLLVANTHWRDRIVSVNMVATVTLVLHDDSTSIDSVVSPLVASQQ